MWNDWKKKLSLLTALLAFEAWSLPDIPSFQYCNDMLFHAGFQNHSDPSLGSRGLLGSQTIEVFSEGAMRSYHVYVPTTYTDPEAMPLLIAFHNEEGAGTASREAENMRDFWIAEAERSRFIVLAPEGTGADGGWVVGTDFPTILNDILTDVYDLYNIERSRVYGHGFSVGADHMHTLMLFYNPGQFASYIVSSGLLNGSAINEDPMVPANQTDIIPIYFSIGSFDNILFTVLSDFNKFVSAGWTENLNLWLDEFNGGQELDSGLPEKAWDVLCKTSKFH